MEKTNFTTAEASEYLARIGINFTEKTMEVLRCKGKGPRYKKVLSRVYYEKSALDEFATGRTVFTKDAMPRMEARAHA